jgi:hypothetical protein
VGLFLGWIPLGGVVAVLIQTLGITSEAMLVIGEVA